MNEHEVMARQAVKLERLEAENAHLKDNITRARRIIICIGGPLNDNKLAYSKEQLYPFHRIKEELEA